MIQLPNIFRAYCIKGVVFDGIDFKNGQGAVSTFKNFIATDQERSKQTKIQCSKSRNWKTIKLS